MEGCTLGYLEFRGPKSLGEFSMLDPWMGDLPIRGVDGISLGRWRGGLLASWLCCVQLSLGVWTMLETWRGGASLVSMGPCFTFTLSRAVPGEQWRGRRMCERELWVALFYSPDEL